MKKSIRQEAVVVVEDEVVTGNIYQGSKENAAIWLGFMLMTNDLMPWVDEEAWVEILKISALEWKHASPEIRSMTLSISGRERDEILNKGKSLMDKMSKHSQKEMLEDLEGNFMANKKARNLNEEDADIKEFIITVAKTLGELRPIAEAVIELDDKCREDVQAVMKGGEGHFTLEDVEKEFSFLMLKVDTYARRFVKTYPDENY